MRNEVIEAKKALDTIIKKSRVHLYKPIQIGEILYHHRVYNDIDMDDMEWVPIGDIVVPMMLFGFIYLLLCFLRRNSFM